MKVKYLVYDVASANVEDLYVFFQRAFSPVSITVFEPRRSGKLMYAFIQVATKVVPKEFESMRYIHTRSPGHFHEMRESYEAIPLVEEEVEIIDLRTPVEDPILVNPQPPPPPNNPESVAAPVDREYYIPPCVKCGLRFATSKDSYYHQGCLYHRDCFDGELFGNYTQIINIYTPTNTHIHISQRFR
jgi:hypothetical protein